MGSHPQCCGALEVRRRVIDEQALCRLDTEAEHASRKISRSGLAWPTSALLTTFVELALQAQCSEVVV